MNLNKFHLLKISFRHQLTEKYFQNWDGLLQLTVHSPLYLIFTNMILTVKGKASDPTQARSKMNEHILAAGNCDTTHWMIKAKLFLSLTKQILK